MLKKLLKSLILASSLFIAVPASAVVITIPLNYTTDPEDDLNLTLSGTLVIDTTVAGAENRDNRISDRADPQAIPDWITSLTLTVVDTDDTDEEGDQSITFSKSDFVGLAWMPKLANVDNVNFNTNLVTQFDDISFFRLGGNFNSTSEFQQDYVDDEFTLTSTPSPLLIPGVLPIFYFFKKLKKLKKV